MLATFKYAASTLIVAQETQQSKEGGFHKIAQTTSKKAPDLQPNKYLRSSNRPRV